jgi:hypothetical protein
LLLAISRNVVELIDSKQRDSGAGIANLEVMCTSREIHVQA